MGFSIFRAQTKINDISKNNSDIIAHWWVCTVGMHSDALRHLDKKPKRRHCYPGNWKTVSDMYLELCDRNTAVFTRQSDIIRLNVHYEKKQNPHVS